jgi:hypothetical protein
MFHANQKAQPAVMRGPVFLRLRSKGGRGIFLYFPLFPICSHRGHQVLKLFLNIIQNAAQFYPIQFAQSSTLMYINWKGGPRRAHQSLFCLIKLRSPKPLFLPFHYLTCSLWLEGGVRSTWFIHVPLAIHPGWWFLFFAWTWVLPPCTFLSPLFWVLCFIDIWQVFITLCFMSHSWYFRKLSISKGAATWFETVWSSGV